MEAATAQSTPTIEPDKLLTSHEAGLLIQVNPSTINKWVEQGRIQAFRTPGGHRRIRARDLATFLNDTGMPVPAALAFAQRKVILIADDDPATAQVIRRGLKKHPVEVVHVVDLFGLALEIGKRDAAVDLVLVDISIAPLTGSTTVQSVVDMVRRIRQIMGNVIVTGAFATQDIRDQYHAALTGEAGVVNVLTTPFVIPKELLPHLKLEALAGG